MEPREKHDALLDQIEKIPADIESIRERLAKAEKDLAVVAERLNNAREKRQVMISKGESVEGISSEINQLREEKELLEDQVLGFEKRIESLIEMQGSLAEQKHILGLEVGREKINALIGPYNDAALKLGEISKKIILLALQYGSESAWNWNAGLFRKSSRDGFDNIPRLARQDEPGPEEDIFDLPRLRTEIREAYIKRLGEVKKEKGEKGHLGFIEFLREFQKKKG